MKKLFFTLLIATSFTGLQAQTINNSDSTRQFIPPKDVVRFQVSNLVKESIQFDFEKRLSPNKSIIISPNATWYEYSDDEATGAGLEFALRKYSHLNLAKSKNWNTGFFVSTKLAYNYVNLDYVTTESTYTANNGWIHTSTSGNSRIHQVQAGSGVGFHFILKNSISIDTSIGSRIRFNVKNNGNVGGSNRTMNIFQNGFSPFFKLGLGIISRENR